MSNGSVKAAIDALSAQPALLFIILLNMVVVGGVGWFLAKQEEARAEGIRILLERCVSRPEDQR
jgi:hypothetical protein